VKKLTHLIIFYLFEEFKSIVKPVLIPGILLPRIGACLFIVLNNFMGLFPHVFTSSAHLSFTLRLTIPLWAGHYLLSWARVSKSNFAHLVPLGSPMFLGPAIVLIELIRNLIRPITLSVRLAANMVAGHLLMVLLRNPICFVSFKLASLGVLVLSILVILECAVAFIQSYVFRVLSVLYVNEIEKTNLI
jgi:F-type H+-transporting ATPase subunit a